MTRSMDRVELSRKTLPSLFNEKDIDVYWLDGSRTEEGKAFAATELQDYPGLCEVHTGINYGSMRSYLYGVRILIERGYEYLGFHENDVELLPGWFQTTFNLFQRGTQDGLNVGTVSPRCIADRVLVPRDGYSVMGNVGAGMVMMHKDVFLKLANDESRAALDNPQFKMSDIRQAFLDLTGTIYPVNWRMKRDLEGGEFAPGTALDWMYSNDWWWEVILLKFGMVALAPTPSMAHNIDEEGLNELVVKQSTSADANFDWANFTGRLNQQATKQAERKTA
ncbi:MAG TPA: hypothetical protein VFR09_02520 [Alphaproteobacteria bacterium]|nr:hypothetical protein [Alphaproteobacteria bacterium]